ncbi:MAG: hypothetical protein MNSN_00850 [Minisyncoccus archaeiphilus]|nr:MAG: hypothetical protein MNSN_00850 [Candidatus Parcubacteria bacterium]
MISIYHFVEMHGMIKNNYMNREKYFPPKHKATEFHCPHCDVYAKQRWSHLSAGGDQYSTRNHDSNIKRLTTIEGNLAEVWTVSFCEHCGDMVIWFNGNIIFPKKIIVEQPNSDLNEDIRSDYLEAANVLADSPRSAAAILRLALQKLCIQLGEKGDNINNDIANLVKKGLNSTIQKSLDALRITGNNAVHPGELNLKEDTERVMKLFGLINFIAEKMITEPKEIDSFYDNLPEGAIDAVEKRDAK